MVLLLFNIILLIYKLTIYSLFSNEQLFFKFIFSLIIGCICLLLYKHLKPLEDNLNTIIDYYKIHSKYDKIFTI